MFVYAFLATSYLSQPQKSSMGGNRQWKGVIGGFQSLFPTQFCPPHRSGTALLSQRCFFGWPLTTSSSATHRTRPRVAAGKSSSFPSCPQRWGSDSAFWSGTERCRLPGPTRSLKVLKIPSLHKLQTRKK